MNHLRPMACAFALLSSGTPLPDGADFDLHLRLDRLLGRPVDVRSVEAIDAAGVSRAPVTFALKIAALTFTAAKADFAYRVNFK